MIDRRLFELDAESAVRLKFQLGRDEHGDAWVGERPIVEAHGELLDALAYVREELLGRTTAFPGRRIPELVLRELYMTLLNALQGVRILVEASGTLDPVPARARPEILILDDYSQVD